jgi:hypothetical protein
LSPGAQTIYLEVKEAAFKIKELYIADNPPSSQTSQEVEDRVIMAYLYYLNHKPK